MIKRIFLNDSFILAIILINAVTIMLSAFTTFPANVVRVILITDNVITILFILELIIKTNHLGFRGYLKDGWNRLDFILIILSIPALISWIFGLSSTGMSFFLVFRVLRVFKSFRFLKFIPGINELIQGVRRALKTSFVIILGFAVYIFIVGILTCYMYRRVCPEYFGDPVLSFYSIFKVFTMEGWAEIPDLIATTTSNAISVLTKIYFVIILVTGGIFGLSLVNSIFVDAMLSDNTDDLSDKLDNLDTKLSHLDEKIESIVDSQNSQNETD